MPKPYPAAFRRKALDLVESGRSVREVAATLGIAELENEVKILRKAAAAVEEVVPPKRRFEPPAVPACETQPDIERNSGRGQRHA